MNKGPLLNDINIKDNNQDPLGLQGVSQSIVGNICPIINSVTPHAFYWIFVNWVYYDVYETRHITDFSNAVINGYLKKYNYFLVLGNRFNGIDINEMMGTRNINNIKLNVQDTYSYDDHYIQNITTINYYKAALTTAGFITDKDQDGIDYNHIHLTRSGESLALALDKYIKNTLFYSEYASKDNLDNVPYEVIKDFGKVVDFNMPLLKEAKEILRHCFFDINITLHKQAKFIKYLYYDLNIKDINENNLRLFLYDYFSPRGQKNNCNPEYIDIVRGWEILIARHFFINAIEMIFKYILENILDPIMEDKLIESLLENIPNINLNDYLNKNQISSNEIDQLLQKGKDSKQSHFDTIENALKILCSLYGRLNNRNDINTDFLKLNNYGASISLQKMLNDIDLYKNKPIKEYLTYIITVYVIQQHILTARRKLLLNEDTFFMGYDNEIIYKINKKPFSYDYQNLRINQLFSVMKELDMLGEF